MTQTPETPNDRLDRLETTLTRFAELSFQSYRQHDETLNRLEATIERNHQEMMEMQRYTNSRFDALSQTQAECLQLIATNTVEISRIWQYLERQTGNGRGNA